MGNRAILTLEDENKTKHPVALYLQWNGGLESVLAFLEYTWKTFDRGHGDLYTFHARLCQVIGNFFPDGLCLYSHRLSEVDAYAPLCDNGHWHFRVSPDGLTLLNRSESLEQARQHKYWTNTPNILQSIADHMPQPSQADLLHALKVARDELAVYHMSCSEDADTKRALQTADAAIRRAEEASAGLTA